MGCSFVESLAIVENKNLESYVLLRSRTAILVVQKPPLSFVSRRPCLQGTMAPISNSPIASMDADDKNHAEHIDFAEVGETGSDTMRREAPPFIQRLSPERRAELEKKLVRRIDRRLMPMIVLMVISQIQMVQNEALTILRSIF